MSRIRKHTSPGLVLGVVAIVIALAGTSLAGDSARTAATAKTKVSQVTQQLSLAPNNTVGDRAEATVNCPAGTKVVGGGGLLPPGTPLNIDIVLYESGPQGNGWHVRYSNEQATAQSVTVNALCLKNKLKVK